MKKLFSQLFSPQAQRQIPTKRGFTLIETFVAITILMIAVVGPLTIAQRSLSSARYARDRVTAFYLAQDTIEYIRSVREDMFYAVRATAPTPIDWTKTNFLTKVAPCMDNWCNINTLLVYNGGTDPFATCGLDKTDCSWMEFQSGAYQEIPNTTSGQFRRAVYMKLPPTNSNELQIKVNVAWNSGLAGGLGEVEVNENLFDWQDF